MIVGIEIAIVIVTGIATETEIEAMTVTEIVNVIVTGTEIVTAKITIENVVKSERGVAVVAARTRKRKRSEENAQNQKVALTHIAPCKMSL